MFSFRPKAFLGLAAFALGAWFVLKSLAANKDVVETGKVLSFLFPVLLLNVTRRLQRRISQVEHWPSRYSPDARSEYRSLPIERFLGGGTMVVVDTRRWRHRSTWPKPRAFHALDVSPTEMPRFDSEGVYSRRKWRPFVRRRCRALFKLHSYASVLT